MKDRRFGENDNVERLQLLFSQMVMGMSGDQQAIETFGQFVEQKGESWARAQLGAMRDGYPTVMEDGEGKEYTVGFRMDLRGDLSLRAASPEEALDRFLKLEPRRLPIECCFDDCVRVESITDKDGRKCLSEEEETEHVDEGYGRIQEVLAFLTGTKTEEWQEYEGVDTHVGLDYYFETDRYHAWINLDQITVVYRVYEKKTGDRIVTLESDDAERYGFRFFFVGGDGHTRGEEEEEDT